MSHQAKRELLMQITMRYREAERCEKGKILDEFVEVTGYAQKYAIRVLCHPPDRAIGKQTRKRERQYGETVCAALEVAWSAANGIVNNYWRSQIFLKFDTHLTMDNASLMTHSLPAPLQAIAISQLTPEVDVCC